MGILALIFVFVIGAVIAASEGDFSGIEIIGRFVLVFVLGIGMMYMVAGCMGGFN